MSNRYLLPCDCGQTVEVTASQAGEQVVCECGQRLEAPTLRMLRELEPAPQDDSLESTWGLNQALFTVGLIVTCLLAAGSAYFAVIEPDPPPPFDPVERATMVNQNLQKLTPLEIWGMWTTAYQPLEKVGLAPMQTLGETRILALIETCQAYRNRLMAAAVIVFLLSVVVYKATPSGAPIEGN